MVYDVRGEHGQRDRSHPGQQPKTGQAVENHRDRRRRSLRSAPIGARGGGTNTGTSTVTQVSGRAPENASWDDRKARARLDIPVRSTCPASGVSLDDFTITWCGNGGAAITPFSSSS